MIDEEINIKSKNVTWFVKDTEELKNCTKEKFEVGTLSLSNKRVREDYNTNT